MREIDNNRNNVNFKGIQKVQAEVPVEQENSSAPQPEVVEIKDLANMPAAALGKSLIASDSIESDLKILEKNPGLVDTLNKAIDAYSANHTEEETLRFIEKVNQEFVAKK